MSVRAYRVTKLEYAGEHSFNLWHDEELAAFILNGANSVMGDTPDFIEVSTEVLREAIAKLKLDPEQVALLEKDIAAGDEDSGFVLYTCF